MKLTLFKLIKLELSIKLETVKLCSAKLNNCLRIVVLFFNKLLISRYDKFLHSKLRKLTQNRNKFQNNPLNTSANSIVNQNLTNLSNTNLNSTNNSKISLNGNFSCPNIDGTLSNKGCLYCSKLGSGEFAGNKNDDLIIVSFCIN